MVEIGRGEGAFEIEGVKRRGEIGMDLIGLESAADLKFAVGIGVILFSGFLRDSLNAGELFEGEYF